MGYDGSIADQAFLIARLKHARTDDAALLYVLGGGALLVLWVTMAMWIAMSVVPAFLIFTFQDIR